MLRASLLSLALSSTALALLGDWKVWTPIHESRMAVVTEDVAWIATSSGIVEWDLRSGVGRIHTRLDGLPTMDYASVVLDSQKTLWAIGTDGRIGYRTKGSSSWKTRSSYSSQNWTFTPRAAQFWKGYLIFGTDRGVSLFSTATLTSEDRASTFGTLSGTVLSVMVTPDVAKRKSDTLWVALEHGLAYATPVWDSIGKPGYFLADPSKWTVRSMDTTKSPDNILVRSAGTVKLSNRYAEWSDVSGDLRILWAKSASWSGHQADVDGLVYHAAPWGDRLLVSTAFQGPRLVAPDGTLQSPDLDEVFPEAPPTNVRFGLDGTPYALSGSRILTYPSTSGWNADTVRSTIDGKPVELVYSNAENLNRHRQALAIGPEGEVVAPGFVSFVTKGGIYTSKKAGGWNHFVSTDTDTCLSYSDGTAPTAGSAITSARAFLDGGLKGTWLSVIPHGETSPARIAYLKSGGQSAPTCFDVPRENTAAGKVLVNDFLAVGDTLWIASNTGLIRVPSPRPTYPPPLSAASYIKPSNQVNPDLYRLAKISFEGRDWIVGAAKTRLVLFPTSGGWGNASRMDLITSDSSAPELNQDYYVLAVDAQGQIWAGGNEGIDIVQLVPSDIDSLPPSFQRVQRITTADGLLDNIIYDFDLQPATGKAIIATPHGVAIWSSPFRPLPTRLAKSNVRVYPNPVRLRDHRGGSAHKTLIVDGATADSRLDLLAADGTLVMHLDETQQVGGRFQVELPPPSKLRPGLYFWSLRDKKGSVRGPLLVAE